MRKDNHRRKNILQTKYTRDKKTKAYIFEIQVDQYSDLFNDLDPSPLKRRDLDQDFITYLEESSYDIPLQNQIVLHIYIPEDVRNKEQENRVISGLKTYYNFLLMTMNHQISISYKNFIIYLCISLSLLFTGFYLGSKISENFLLQTLVEGFYIGGWVFFWEAIALLAFKTRELRDSSRRYNRISNAGILFFNK
ncbi:MAG: hypothetical protein JEY91_11175 [Spirochaetaceae bacterium]|nr:hypothetical protein [Spirochaetaceae bacterium]